MVKEIRAHSDSRATKADFAELKAQNKLLIGLVIGLYVGIVLLYIEKIVG